MSRELNAEHWANRYREGNTPWDAGQITTPIKAFIDQLDRKDIKILIPGAGNGHEAEYLIRSGFEQVFICDWAIEPLQNLQSRIPQHADDQFLHQNFFELEGQYDLIVEQTFLSALLPEMRDAYARKMSELLNPDGQLVGVLFQPLGIPEGPPFSASKVDNEQMFAPYFEEIRIEACYNSIPPRAGNEWFIKIRKPKNRLQ